MASLQWQHPYVDIFKTFGTDVSKVSPFPATSLVAVTRGDVSEEMDRDICKHVFRIQGSVSANNFIRLPSAKVKTMGLTGEYIYLLLKSVETKHFVVHLDFLLSSGVRQRISMSNIYAEVKVSHGCIQCPCQLPSTWTVLRLHISSLLSSLGLQPRGFQLRKLQLCACLVVKGAFTSDRCYLPGEVPKDFLGTGMWTWLAVPPTAVVETEPLAPHEEAAAPEVEIEAEQEVSSSRAMKLCRVMSVIPALRRISLLETSRQVPHRFAVFLRREDDPASESLKVASIASQAVALLEPGQEREVKYFFGHTRPLQLLEVSDDGQWLASLQEGDGRPPLVRLWRCRRGLECRATLPLTSLSAVQSIAFDGSARFLAVTGQDARERQNLLVWDISRAKSGAVKLFAQQLGPDTSCVRFSPFEELNLVSCGLDNIRFWRVKEKHIPGCLVPLGTLGRMHFTAIAFECRKLGHSLYLSETMAEKVRVFVGASDGRVLQIGYRSRRVLSVHQAHSEAILDISANDVFVVTCSCDGFVRVWPLDFESFYLHSSHGAEVVGLDVPADGSKVLCSCADGSVGVLDVRSHHYTELHRSHKGSILQAAASPYGELATAAEGCVKVWSPSFEQVCEFPIAEVPQALAFHPTRRTLAVAFESSVSLFDLKTKARQEVQGGAVALRYAGSAQELELVTCDSSSAAIYDEDLRLLRSFPCAGGVCSGHPAINAKPPRLLWPVGTRSAVLLGLVEGRSLAMLSAPEGSKVCCCGFSQQGGCVVLMSERQVHIYQAEGGSHLMSCRWSSPTRDLVLLEGHAFWLLTATDRQLRVAQLNTEEEQCYAGHVTAPQQLLVAQGRCYSVSSSEMISWDLAAELAELMSQELESEATLVEVPGGPGDELEPAGPESGSAGATGEGPSQLTAESREDLTEQVEVQEEGCEHAESPQEAEEAEEVKEVEEREEPEEVKEVEEAKQVKLEMEGFHGCSLARPQSLAWQNSRFCYILGRSICVEDLETRCSELLTLPDEGSWQAVALDLDGQILVALLVDSNGRMQLSRWDLTSHARRHDLALHWSHDSARLLVLDGLTVTAGPCLEVWRETHVACGVVGQVLEMLRLQCGEFAVLEADGLSFWRVDDEWDTQTSAGDDLELNGASLLFQRAEPPVGWAWPCAAMAGELWEEKQLIFVVSATGMLWTHDADDNVAVSLLQLPCTSGPSVVVASSYPLLAYACGSRVHGGSLDSIAAAPGRDLDGPVMALKLNGEKGLAVVANAIWYLDFGDGSVMPLRSFHEAPCIDLVRCGCWGKLDEAHEALCTWDAKQLCLWRATGGEVLQVARVSLEAQASAVVFLPDGFLGCGLRDGTVLFFDIHMFGLVSQAKHLALRDGEELSAMEVVVDKDLQLLLGTSCGRILQAKLHGFNKAFQEVAPGFSLVTGSIQSLGSMLKSPQLTTGILAMGSGGELGIWTREKRRWHHVEVLAEPGELRACFLPCQRLVAVGALERSCLVMYSCVDGSVIRKVDAPWPVDALTAVPVSGRPAALLCAGGGSVAALVAGEWLEAQPLPGSAGRQTHFRAPTLHGDGFAGFVWVQTEAALSAWRIRDALGG